MHDSKLIRTLRTLEAKDFSRLHQSYHSAFFDPGPRAVALLDHVLKYKPSFTSPQLRKEKVYPFLFDKDEDDDVKIRLITSAALKAVQQFIAVNKVLSDSLFMDMQLLEHFSKAENDEFTLKRMEEFEKKLRALPFRNERYYYLNFRVEEMKNNYFTKRSEDYDLSALLNNLEGFYFLNKLKLVCVRLSHNFILRKEENEVFISEIEQSLRAKQFSDDLTILAYSYCALLLIGSNPGKQFENLFDLLQHSSDQVNPPDNIIFHKILENYCIRQINAGENQRYDQLYHLQERRLMNAEEITSSEVKTFVTLCLRMNKAEIAWKFLHEKKQQIFPAEIREDAFNYSMAVYWFYKKDYSQVLQLLQQVEYLNIFYKLGSKKLLIETYFELEEWDSLDSAMNAFRVFIHRNQEISELHKKNNSNFVNFLYKLLSSSSTDAARLKSLKEKLVEEQQLSERQWLLEKINERLKVFS